MTSMCSSSRTTCRSAVVLPPGFVRLAEVAPSILQDMRYAGDHNFTGRSVPGYEAADCWLHKAAALALARVAVKAEGQDLVLVVYEGYRPQRATDAFVIWAADPADEITKAAYYPNIDKSRLFAEGYIGPKSYHSTGLAVDVGLARRDGTALDFGTHFDLFDLRSATAHPALDDAARVNRARLVSLMDAENFENYPREWWHFRLRGFPGAATYDLPIRRL